MISHKQIRAALRAKIATLSVCTTGAISMSATAAAFVRGAGVDTFYTDGFAPGMELVSTGFPAADNLTASIVGISADGLTCTIDRALTVAVSAAARSLAVGLPLTAVYIGEGYTADDPDPTEPYWKEGYVPGPMVQISFGAPGGLIVARPTFTPQILLPRGLGTDAADAYVDALLTHFAPGTVMTLTNGDLLRVRVNPAPYAGQMLNDDTGRLVASVNIPLELLTANSI